MKHKYVFLVLLLIMILFLPSEALISCDGTDLHTALTKVRNSKKDLIPLTSSLHCLVCEEFLYQPDTFDTLVSALQEDNTNVRAFAARLLYIIKDSRAIKVFKEHLKWESHPDIRGTAEHAIKSLQESRKQGYLKYVDGKQMSRVSFKESSNTEVYRVNESSRKSYRVTDVYDFRQSIAKKGFIHFVVPSQYASFLETDDFKFSLSSDHLLVYDKSKKHRHLYTESDGFGPICKKEQTYSGNMVNFKNHLAIEGCAYAFILDKESRKISRLSLTEFASFKKTHPLDPPLKRQTPEQWKKTDEVEKVKLRGHLFNGSNVLNEPSFVCSNDRIMAASTGTGLRMFEGNKETGFLDASSGLHGSPIRTALFRMNLLLVGYIDYVDIFDTAKGFKRLYRLKTPTPEGHKHYSNMFDDTYLYLTRGGNYSAVVLDGGRTVFHTTIEDDILKTAQDKRTVYLMTAKGIIAWDKKSHTLQSYRLLSGTPKNDSDITRISKSLRWDGKSGRCLIGRLLTFCIDSVSKSTIRFDT
ncbi:MAG: HEAT repeat domain-containing protein [bacterium]|nr:HEAT repeat domain-containing protein [bacterium]